MRAILYMLTSLAVIGLAFWAYRENYATQQALSEADKLREGIRTAHSRLAVLKAEWAYENRPDRLRDLADINFDRLGLLPLHPDQFGQLDQVAYPPPPPLPITDPVDVSTMNGKEVEPL
ncbi:cell division protein FtsL [Sulfitobacter aestuariivivens]|uniref:Cell division protein FtsL n=1 Tax=Sulfitobacter aestuariivivens TaxID=2766981 RepID=A0A927D6F2_9RHOB|nr:cell division protein FtsL [Sulfitobacter aestuariivivens]MBD3663661.1 cell division protein FtsL [Sulfitobacter aestuariivivens]